MSSELKIVSWNVNGIRAAHRKGLLDFVQGAGAEIVALQEVRATGEQVPAPLRAPPGFVAHYASAERPGYSGVGLLSRTAPGEVVTSLQRRELDVEGRVLMARFGALRVVSAYFPNGNGKQRDNSRVPYKLRFYRRLFRVLQPAMRAGQRIVVVGDFNTAHQEIDLARPRQNRETSGFLPEERALFGQVLKRGWIDSFRHFQPDGGHYTWWSQRAGVRARNVGWRIDYGLVSPAVLPFLRGAGIQPDVMGSDHCPIDLTLDRAVLRP